MVNKVVPSKLSSGDEIRVIAPSRSLVLIGKETREIANRRFFELGLKVSFGQKAEESDELISSSIESRVKDLHEAFLDPNVKAVFTAIGGFNTNQILRYIDWDIIKNNPKIFCGYSDITILNNAIYSKTGLVTYYGPHYSTLGQEKELDYTLDYFKKTFFSPEPISVLASSTWTDDQWYLDQNNRQPIESEGWWGINQGEARGRLIGGNLDTFKLLTGTEYLPSLEGAILVVEEDELAGDLSMVEFDRNLQALIHLPDFGKAQGIIVGRFQKKSNMSREKLEKVFKSKRELNNLPILANLDFGHTDPKMILPIGGEALLVVTEEKNSLTVVEH